MYGYEEVDRAEVTHTVVYPKAVPEIPPEIPPEAEGATLWFWREEDIFAPPAARSDTIRWEGNLYYAMLHVNIDLRWPIHLDKITLNGYVLPGSSGAEGAHRSYDVRPYIANGKNHCRIDYSGYWPPIGPAGKASVSLEVWADRIVEVKGAVPPPPWWELVRWDYVAYAALGIAGMAAAGYVLHALGKLPLPKLK